jgi:ornithine cyclodeaminase/alanine dehydrogenase-like protein (mu-crystallin family)
LLSKSNQNCNEEKKHFNNSIENCLDHGVHFTTMRDYLAEQTDIDHATAEICLAHTVGSAVERSYRRDDLLEKRRVAMQIWGNFTESHES